MPLLSYHIALLREVSHSSSLAGGADAPTDGTDEVADAEAKSWHHRRPAITLLRAMNHAQNLGIKSQISGV